MPTAPVREPEEKRAVEELVGSEEGAARAKRGPPVGFAAAAALGVSRPGPEATGSHPTLHPQLRGAFARPLPFKAQRLRET